MHKNPKELIGAEFHELLNVNHRQAQLIFNDNVNIERQILCYISIIKTFLFQTIGKKQLIKIFRVNKVKTVKLFEKLSDVIEIKNIAKGLKISSASIYEWRHQVRYACENSPLKLCRIKNSGQATLKEIKVIKKQLTDSSKLHWPIASVWAWAFRKKLAFMSLSTWYRYRKALEIRVRQTFSAKGNYNPLRASFPNQIWHMDISIIRTLDHKKHYLYTLKDNYSKKIVAWFLHHRVDGEITTLLIKKASTIAFGSKVYNNAVQIVSDGGSENTSLSVKEFISKAKTEFIHTIALKDIYQSNSMIEVFFRNIKTYFLSGKQIPNRKKLFRLIAFYIHEYNAIKPHSAHRLFTPDEVFFGFDKDYQTPDELIKTARQNRIKINQNSPCNICKP